MQDRKIPIARVTTSSDYGIGMTVDIEGNCRFYDLIRFRKMAKISAQPARMDDVRVGPNNFRLMFESCISMS